MVANWQYKKIADVCSVLTDGNWIESKDQSLDGIRLIQTGNIGNGVFKDKGDKARYISEETFERLSCTEIFEGDVLVSRLPEPIGRSCILPKLEQRTVTAVDCSILRFKKDLLNKFFVFFTLSPAYDRALKNYITGSSRKRISRSNLGLIKVPVPPIEDQQRIVDELDLLSDIIDKKKAQLRDLDALTQSIFYEMFGDPITNDKGWPVCHLEEIASSQIGLTYKPKNVSDTGTVVLRSSNIQNSLIDLNDIVRVNCDIKEKQFVREGDILMCSRNGSFRLVGKVARIQNLPERMSYGAFMTIIRSDYNDYLFGFFKTPAFRAQLGLAKTATINQITVKMLNAIQLPVPPKDIQASFAERISHISSQQNAIIESLKDIQHLFDSRMSLYFG